MEFIYNASIWIKDEDLDKMAKRVAKGEDYDEDFEEIFDNIMCDYDELTYLSCDYIKEQVEFEVRRRVSEMLLFSQFVDKYCRASGGNWTKMIADGIGRAFPEIYEEKVKDKELSFKDLIDILWKYCGVVFD